ncbi:hypothetical protein SELMODRAFT_413528 [Selaginella moellendorffii]|uniref:CHAT domain-containing protein n=1 Tax=Selaginella moellendorffii TaxID=88036 RepID=D8RQK0_SELML|nr:uncharacterized protein LOC9637762 isoform X2 [Selaginella moellendorffii]XP_024533924.1 uncharacterized protein LOC9637762 isoform X1 [Selaginella moellendorffii]EFJ25667.1 hypothetical protein SELMODRAFT_413528 [Selaginella moellendorffii]|eukprot:XP_002973293.1 uncharacterized protein LOC9637762 isoform X2 [Selaginella moellendorffii]
MARSGIRLHDKLSAEVEEIGNSLDKLRKEEDPEEQESQICQLLQTLALDRDHELPALQIFRSEVWMKMADLSWAYYDRLPSGDPPLLLVNEFMAESIRLAECTYLRRTIVPLRLWHHGYLLWKMGFDVESVRKYEEMIRCWLRVNSNFGYLSTGRITNLESIKYNFDQVQSSLCALSDFKRALLWFERGHARDMLFLATTEGDHEKLDEFDMDDEKAWGQVEVISKDVGIDTVILVISHIGGLSVSDGRVISYGVASYLLHNGELVGHNREWDFKACSPSALLELLQANNADKALRDYYHIIVKPFESQLESIQPKTLVIVPNEDVSFVPFGAMIDEDDKYLIERYALATVSSLRLLKHCDKRRQVLQQQQQQRQSRSLIVGNPTRDLYYATEEAEMVGSLLKSANAHSVVNLVREDDATKEFVLRQLPESDWIHIASHGTVSTDFPDGALILAVPEEHQDDLAKSARLDRSVEFEECLTRALTTVSNSHRLTGDEVVELAGESPFRASAAVLSACSSGVGRVFAEGILALPRSFHISGVPSVVISLWNVKDKSTQVLMKKIYWNLVQGMDIASALREAVVEMIEANDGSQKLYDVSHWAAFIVSGSPFTTLPGVTRSPAACSWNT